MSNVLLSRDVSNFARVIIWMFTTCTASVETCPAPPSNITVVLIGWSPPSVLVRWRYDCPGLRQFELTYRAALARYRIVHEVEPSDRSVTLDHLKPGVQYQLHVTAITTTGPNISSQTVKFISPDVQNESTRDNGPPFVEVNNFLVREEEIVIVVIVLIVWVAVILLFFNKWGKIRMLEPYHPEYRSQTYSSVLQKQTRVNVNDIAIPDKTSQRFTSLPTYSTQRFRPRQNSVFVTSPSNSNSLMSQYIGMPRKVKSAEDIQSLVVQISYNEMQSTVL